MTIPQVKAEVLSVIGESVECESAITEETHLIEDLGLSSVEAAVLLADLEERFGIRIPIACLRDVQTAGDLCRIVVEALQKPQTRPKKRRRK